MRLQTMTRGMLAAGALFMTLACGDSVTDLEDVLAELHDTWVTDLGPLGHVGYSHLTLSADGSATTDQEFVVAGSDCTLDQEHVGSFVANATTLAIFWHSGAIEVRGCTGANAAANHAERAMNSTELGAANAVGHFSWTVSGDVLTLDNGRGVTRTYTRQ